MAIWSTREAAASGKSRRLRAGTPSIGTGGRVTRRHGGPVTPPPAAVVRWVVAPDLPGSRRPWRRSVQVFAEEFDLKRPRLRGGPHVGPVPPVRLRKEAVASPFAVSY